MILKKAVITAAGRQQRALPVQTLIDREGAEKSVLSLLVEEALHAGLEEIAVVVTPGDEARYAQAVGPLAASVRFLAQTGAPGYGAAIAAAAEFTAGEAFLHLVGDHVYVPGADEPSCARRLVELAQAEACAVSAVQATRESLLPHFGAVGGRRLPGRDDLYMVEAVLEKPTPTEAELRLLVPGLRAGYYLCFFGMHVLTPGVMRWLIEAGAAASLSEALAQLATQEKYLALEAHSQRYDLGAKYGLLTAQLALALSGAEREWVLEKLVELLAQRERVAQRRAA